MILRVLAVSMIGFTLAGCVSSSGLSGDVYSASEAKQVQSVTTAPSCIPARCRSKAAMTAMPSVLSAAQFWVDSS
nr:outer membrane lipoprotein pcp [Raoultella sp. NCTC 9187]